MESVIPVFQLTVLNEVLDFYQALGFKVTYRQEKPYIYAAVQQGRVNIHFIKGTASGMCLVHVPEVEAYHKAFADGLRQAYGKVPSADLPRITRFRKGQTRFTLYDPAGNTMMFINQDEPDIDYDAYDASLSPLMQVLEKVKFLRDTYHDDRAAAKLLDKKLQEHAAAPALERALALATRAELAVAMGDTARLEALRLELTTIQLTDEERTRYHADLQVGEYLDRWLIEDGQS